VGDADIAKRKKCHGLLSPDEKYAFCAFSAFSLFSSLSSTLASHLCLIFSHKILCCADGFHNLARQICPKSERNFVQVIFASSATLARPVSQSLMSLIDLSCLEEYNKNIERCSLTNALVYMFSAE
jgi:hypothetical protein